LRRSLKEGRRFFENPLRLAEDRSVAEGSLTSSQKASYAVTPTHDTLREEDLRSAAYRNTNSGSKPLRSLTENVQALSTSLMTEDVSKSGTGNAIARDARNEKVISDGPEERVRQQEATTAKYGVVGDSVMLMRGQRSLRVGKGNSIERLLRQGKKTEDPHQFVIQAR